MSTRDSLRSAIVGATAEFKKEIVSYKGNDYEVRQPTVAERKEIVNKAKNDSGQLDGFDFMIWSVIFTTFVPGTNEKVFEEGDYKEFSNKPAGGILDKLGEVAGKLMGTEEDLEKK